MQKQLNLKLNGIYEFRDRIQGVCPIYLQSSSVLSEKIIMSSHRNNLHRGVASTIAEAKSLFWIPILRKLTKSVLQVCYVCKRFRAKHYLNPNLVVLPRDRSEQALPFEIVGTVFVVPLFYKSKGKKVLKAYILLFPVVLAELCICS